MAPQSSSTLGNNELITVTVANQGLNAMSNFDLEQRTRTINRWKQLQFPTLLNLLVKQIFNFAAPQDFSVVGDYSVTVMVSHEDDEYENNNTLNAVISKTHEVDAALSIENLSVVCNDVVEVNTVIAEPRRYHHYGGTN